MRLWRCPKCGAEQRALGSEVAHRCPNNRNKMTYFELVERNNDERA